MYVLYNILQYFDIAEFKNTTRT